MEREPVSAQCKRQRSIAAVTQIARQRSVWPIGLMLLCLFSVILPLFIGPGPVHTRGGGDSPFLLVRLEQLVAGLRATGFPPVGLPVRWMPDAAYGLGYPFFNYYAALPYYIAAGLRLLGWGPIRALQATQALGFVLAAAAMALLARRVLGHPAAATLAAVAYTCAPFHLANVYVRGDSLSEFFAFAFYPLILWALLRLRDRPSPAGAAWLALGYGGLILTHNLSALMFSPFVAAFALWVLFVPTPGRSMETAATADRRTGARWRALAWMLGGGILGLALAATLWWTATAELDQVWMGVKDIQTTGYFNYAGHFRRLIGARGEPPLIQPRLLFNYDTSPGDTPFAMGAVQAAAIALGMIVWGVARLRKARGQAFSPTGLTPFWLFGLAASTFTIAPLSRALWDHVPILPIVQFPWRFLSVQAFFGALMTGELALRLPRPWWVAAIATAALTAAAVGGLRPEYLPIAEADVTGERLALFESFTANVGTTIRGEYLPAGVEPGLRASAVTLHRGQRPPPAVLNGDLVRATLEGRDARSEHWRVEVTSEQAHLAFHTLHFAGWQATVDGMPIAIEPLPGSGLISLRVPKGEHTVTLRFGRTGVRRAADLVSLAALLIVAALLWPTIWAFDRRTWRRILRGIAAGLFLLGVLSVVEWAFTSLQEVPSTNDMSMDFDRMPFLHHNPDGIDFGGVRLLSYDYADTVRGGNVLTASLQWDAIPPQGAAWEAELQLVSPADPLDLAPLPPPLARSRVRIASPETTHRLEIPEEARSGPCYLALRVYVGPGSDARQARAINVRGETLGTTYLRPVWVDNPRPARGDETLWARLGDRVLLRDDVHVSTADAFWDVRLTWQAMAPVTANYSLSLRMLAADGGPLAQRDWAEGPGYGFWPTSAWPVGEWLTDHLRLAVPGGVATGDAVAMSVVLYDRSQPGYPALGTAVVPLGGREHRYEAPQMGRRAGTAFGGRNVLLGYDVQQPVAGQDALRLNLYWQAVPWDAAQGTARRNPLPDYVVFVHLYDPESQEIVAQSDARPLNGTYPTNAWQEGEVIGDEIVLSLADVPAGVYRLAIGMVEANGTDRATIVSASGEAVPGGRWILEDRIEVPSYSGT
jgi:hypothetical protein